MLGLFHFFDWFIYRSMTLSCLSSALTLVKAKSNRECRILPQTGLNHKERDTYAWHSSIEHIIRVVSLCMQKWISQRMWFRVCLSMGSTVYLQCVIISKCMCSMLIISLIIVCKFNIVLLNNQLVVVLFPLFILISSVGVFVWRICIVVILIRLGLAPCLSWLRLLFVVIHFIRWVLISILVIVLMLSILFKVSVLMSTCSVLTVFVWIVTAAASSRPFIALMIRVIIKGNLILLILVFILLNGLDHGILEVDCD